MVMSKRSAERVHMQNQASRNQNRTQSLQRAIICQKNLHASETTLTMGADELVISDSPIHPANLICELCRLFYSVSASLRN